MGLPQPHLSETARPHQGLALQGCDENFEDEQPWWDVIECSTHGQQLQQANDEDLYWCVHCEEDDFQHAYRQLFTTSTLPTDETTKEPAPPLPATPRTHRRITTSIKIDDELWRAVKHHCVEAKITIADYLEQLVRDELRK